MNTKSETHISTNGLYYVYASYTITDRTISQSAVKRNGVAYNFINLYTNTLLNYQLLLQNCFFINLNRYEKQCCYRGHKSSVYLVDKIVNNTQT